MTDTSKFDDDWAELARELERDKPSSPPPPAASNVHPDIYRESEESQSPEILNDRMDAAITDEFDDVAEESLESDSESEPNEDSVAGDGPQGVGKKRRRRRRRRRKGGGGQPAEVGSVEEMETDKADSNDGENEEMDLGTEPAVGEMDDSDEPADEMEEVMVDSSDSEEDSGGELLRELIANWNVPSWDDVVGGLYRPER